MPLRPILAPLGHLEKGLSEKALYVSVQDTQIREIDWCPFCGGRLGPKKKRKTIYYQGRHLEIHKSEYPEFLETGLLRYIDEPRRWPISQDAVDLLLGVGSFVVIMGLIVWLFRLG